MDSGTNTFIQYIENVNPQVTFFYVDETGFNLNTTHRVVIPYPTIGSMLKKKLQDGAKKQMMES